MATVHPQAAVEVRTVIGLDPGTETGFAVWHPPANKFATVTSMKVHEALAEVLGFKATHSLGELLVVFEDARLRKWFARMDAKQARYGAAVREGAGAAKRDATIWDDFLTDLQIPFQRRKPAAGTTKWSQTSFTAYTGWTAKTNEHARDAGVLVYGVTPGMAWQWVRNARELQEL